MPPLAPLNATLIGNDDIFLDLLKFARQQTNFNVAGFETFNWSKKTSLLPINSHPKLGGRLHRTSYISVSDPIFPDPM